MNPNLVPSSFKVLVSLFIVTLGKEQNENKKIKMANENQENLIHENSSYANVKMKGSLEYSTLFHAFSIFHFVLKFVAFSWDFYPFKTWYLFWERVVSSFITHKVVCKGLLIFFSFLHKLLYCKGLIFNDELWIVKC